MAERGESSIDTRSPDQKKNPLYEIKRDAARHLKELGKEQGPILTQEIEELFDGTSPKCEEWQRALELGNAQAIENVRNEIVSLITVDKQMLENLGQKTIELGEQMNKMLRALEEGRDWVKRQ